VDLRVARLLAEGNTLHRERAPLPPAQLQRMTAVAIGDENAPPEVSQRQWQYRWETRYQLPLRA
jgi:hypothetical protein